jgi:hypothetical protein
MAKAGRPGCVVVKDIAILPPRVRQRSRRTTCGGPCNATTRVVAGLNNDNVADCEGTACILRGVKIDVVQCFRAVCTTVDRDVIPDAAIIRL